MKKLHVIAMADRREALLKGLLHLGCVEISQPEEVLSDPEWAALFRRSETLLTQRKAELAAIGQYAKLKNGLFIKRHPITEAEFLDTGAAERAKAACEAVREQLGVLMQAKTEKGHIASQIAALTPWRELDLPLEQTGTAHTIFRMGVCPGQTDTGALRAQMEAEGLAAELYEIGADKLQKYLLLIVHRADEERTQELLRPFGFSGGESPQLGSGAGGVPQDAERRRGGHCRRCGEPGRPAGLCRPAPGRGGQGAVRRGYPDG